MALLLRMGGVPARVSAGFTSGYLRVSRLNQWAVSDLDAHAWVEAWFPSYGWVRFDPTPGVGARNSAGGERCAVPKLPAGGGGAQGQLHRAIHDIPTGSRGRQRRKQLRTVADPRGRRTGAGRGWGAACWRCGGRGRHRRRGEPRPGVVIRARARTGSQRAARCEGGHDASVRWSTARSSPDAAAYVRALRLSRSALPATVRPGLSAVRCARGCRRGSAPRDACARCGRCRRGPSWAP